MRKTLGVVVFVVLTILTSAIPASANGIAYIPQTLEGMYYRIQGNQVQMLTADNLGLVNGLTDQLRRAGYRSVAEDWVFNGAAYGINTSNGFHPMYDRNRQPLSGRQRIERGAGIVMMVDGVRRAVANPRSPWGWVEAAAGAVLTNDSRYRGQPKNQRDNGVIVMPPPSQDQPSVYRGSDGIPVAVGTRPRSRNVQSSLGIGSQPSGLTRRAVNRTGMEVAVFQTGADPSREEPLMVLTRGEGFEVPLTDGGYDVYILVPTNRLGVQDVRRATVVPNHDLNGWDIVVAP